MGPARQSSGVDGGTVSPTKLVLAGEQRTDGLELAANGQLSDKWQVYAGYAYLDAEITKSNSRTNGVANEGQVPTLTPRHSANLWLVRSLTQNWRVGMGANYVDDRYTALDNNVVMPAYTTMDAALLYNQPKWDMALRLRMARKQLTAAGGGWVVVLRMGSLMKKVLRFTSELTLIDSARETSTPDAIKIDPSSFLLLGRDQLRGIVAI